MSPPADGSPLVPQLTALLESHLGARFAVEGVIGSGGMSTVILATDRRHGRKVAIKVLREDVAAGTGRARFLREIELAARLTHPNILPIHDSGDLDGLLFYVMPYLAGESVAARLAREGPLPIQDAVAIAIDCAEALDHAHRNGVVHRDVKPGNVLLSDGRAVLADFGIAKGLTGSSEEITRSGVSLGTPLYMSPEQASGETRIDGRADVYALGCVLYEMIVGEPPFGGPNAQVVLARHLAGEHGSLKVARPSVPDALAEAVERALEKNPADRYPSAHAFAEALRTVSRPTVQHDRRRSALVAGTALALLLGALVLRTTGWGRESSSEASTRSGSGDSLDPAQLAILPFTVSGSSQELRAFAESLHGRLIDGLATIEELHVISELGVRRFAGAPTQVDSIARALGAGTLVSGRLAADDDSVQVDLSVVEGGTGRQLAHRTLRTSRSDRLALVDAAADSLLRQLRRTLGPTVQRRQRLIETSSLAAYEHLERAAASHAELDAAIQGNDLRRALAVLAVWDSLLSEAERLDPAWIEPTLDRATLVEQKVHVADVLRSGADLGALYREGLAHVERALQVRPSSPAALGLRGRLEHRLWSVNGGDTLLERAERDLRASLSANPRRAQMHLALTELLLDQGRVREALSEAENGYAVDPYLQYTDYSLVRLVDSSFEFGEDSLATVWCQQGARDYPGMGPFQHCRLRLMAWSDADAPRPDTAWALLKRLLEGIPASVRGSVEPDFLPEVAAVLARAGLADSARAVLRRVPRDPQSAHGAAVLAGALILSGGDREAADLIRNYLRAFPQQREDLSRRRELQVGAAPPEVRRALAGEP